MNFPCSKHNIRGFQDPSLGSPDTYPFYSQRVTNPKQNLHLLLANCHGSQPRRRVADADALAAWAATCTPTKTVNWCYASLGTVPQSTLAHVQ